MVMQCSGAGEISRGNHTFREDDVMLLEFVSQPKPTASGAVGPCAFHDDHPPSFGVDEAGNYWHRFARRSGVGVTSRRPLLEACPFIYIEAFYRRHGLHSALDYFSPEAYEQLFCKQELPLA